MNIPLIPTNRERIATKILFVAIGVFIFVAIGGAKTASAASLYFSPSSGSYTAGSSLTLNVYVSSADQAMNAASGVISFPNDKLEVVSLSKTGSIFSLWVQEPSFLNTAGTVNFEGIVMNPGFTGASGKILSITFRTKAAGSAPLTFSSGSVLANDGKGTNILASLGSASFSLEVSGLPAQTGAAPAPAASISNFPKAPEISSETHPDSDKWYNKKIAKFNWDLPAGTTGVRLLIGKIPEAVPAVTYSPAVSSKTVEDLEDGIWYFHARFRNSAGWGETSHFKIQIDTEPPESFEIKFADGKETENSRPTISFETTDTLSGIDYYKIKIADAESFLISAAAAGVYNLPPQSPGKKTIVIQVYDKAGNFTSASDEFIIKAAAKPAIVEEERPAWLKASSWLIVLAVVAITISALFYFLWHLWQRFLRTKKRLQKEVRDVDRSLRGAFNLLREDIRRQVKLLERTKVKRQLTKAEEEIITRLKQDLDETERIVRKEIEDVEKELK